MSTVHHASCLRPRVVFALLLFGCYNPNYTAAGYRCATSADCPEGLLCTGGICGGGTADLSLSPDDLSMGQQDQRESPDLKTPPDLNVPPDMTVIDPNCPKGGGVQVGNKDHLADVYACKGSFDKGKFADLCGASYHACNESDKGRLMMFDRGKCEAAGGFFAASIYGGFRIDGTLACIPGGIVSVLVGCGDEDQVDHVDPKDTACLSFISAFPCNKTSTWSCNGGFDLNNSSHKTTANQGGILCCKN